MFLPKIMIERHGLAGFLAFAIPNVIGCAGFGYVLSNDDRRRALVARHGVAMTIFSLVAVAFHVFFVTFLFADLVAVGPPWLPFVVAIAVYAVGAGLGRLGERAWLTLSVLTWLFSVTAFALIGGGAWGTLSGMLRTDLGGLAWLTPVIVIGFLLCPYLDLTFHRALERSPSRHAFAIFGVTFTVMLVFTCFLWFAPAPVLTGVALGHILAQATFSVGAHLREVRLSPAICCPLRRRVYGLLPLAAVAVLPASMLPYVADDGADLYVQFLVFYALVFPAYVLLFMGPGRSLPLSRGALIGFAITVVLLAPLYELGFLHDHPSLLVVPALAAVLWLLGSSAASGRRAQAEPGSSSSVPSPSRSGPSQAS
jgi:hypothetical protein